MNRPRKPRPGSAPSPHVSPKSKLPPSEGTALGGRVGGSHYYREGVQRAYKKGGDEAAGAYIEKYAGLIGKSILPNYGGDPAVITGFRQALEAELKRLQQRKK